MQAVIIGVRRQGKSTLALHLARQHAKCIIVFDPNNQFKSLYAVDSPERLQWAIEDQEHSEIRYLPDADNVWDSFAGFAECVWYMLAGVYALIIDECQELQSPSNIHPLLARFLRRAPTEVDAPNTTHIYQCTHFPADLHKLSKGLATDWYIFRITLRAQVEAVRDQWGDEIAERVQQLDKYTFLHSWLGEGGSIESEVITDSDSWNTHIARVRKG